MSEQLVRKPVRQVGLIKHRLSLSPTAATPAAANAAMLCSLLWLYVLQLALLRFGSKFSHYKVSYRVVVRGKELSDCKTTLIFLFI